MIISGLIAEYNPLHNGHIYHAQRTRAMGAEGIVCVLGGEFTQRGLPSILSRDARARCALMCGADLVVALPADYSCAAAPDFAFGAVDILDMLGCIDMLSFGSECGDIELLKRYSRAIEESPDRISEEMSSGAGYAAAVERAVLNAVPDIPVGVLSCANNTLAIEYIAALKRLQSNIVPVTVKRIGSGHSGSPEEQSKNDEAILYANASYIRELISDKKEFSGFIPKIVSDYIIEETSSGTFPVLPERLDAAIISRLRMMTSEQLKNTPGVSEGLENRIFRAVNTAVSVDELVKKCVTRRYTAARVRRAVTAAAIGFLKRPENPAYIRVLGFNERGKEILKVASHTAKVPLVSSYSQIKRLGELAERQFLLECRASDLYGMAMPVIRPRGAEMTFKIIRSL